MNIKEAVQKAAIDNDINGVMEMAKHCGLSYEKTVRVWKGHTNAKVSDVMVVLGSMGLTLTTKKAEDK